MLRFLWNDVKVVKQVCKCPIHLRTAQLLSPDKRFLCQLASTRYRAVAQTSLTPTSNCISTNRHRTLATREDSATNPAATISGEDAAPQPPLAIVFTDIVKSTTIWEKDSVAMTEAMAIHDSLIRNMSREYNGYEVKQNGDGFMIAFQSAISALRFCLDVQTQLQSQEWPNDLLQIKPAKPVVAKDDKVIQDEEQDDILWKGLRLRMSIHFGETVCVWNDVIQRMDYLGPIVNRAARFVSVCEGGQVIVSDELLQELVREKRPQATVDGPLFETVNNKDAIDQAVQQGELNEAVGSKFEIRLLGSRHFRGLSEKQRLYFVIPASLKGRLQYFPRHKYVQASKGNLAENGE